MQYINQLRETAKKVTSMVKDNLTKTELERKLKEATRDEQCHANMALLNELSARTEKRLDFPIIYQHCSKKLDCRPEKWRKILKALFLIEHILRTGSTAFFEAIKDDKYKLKNLHNFSYIAENGTDKGETSKSKMI